MREIKASDRVRGARREASLEAARKKVVGGPFLIRRHGYFFRPHAQGYTANVSEAGLFTAEEARSYLDVEGLSVVPIQSMRDRLAVALAAAESAATVLRTMIEVASPAQSP